MPFAWHNLNNRLTSLEKALLQGVTTMTPAQYVATMHSSQPVIMDMYESLTQARLAAALESASGRQAGQGSAAAATDHSYPAHLGPAALDDALNNGLALKVGRPALLLVAIKAWRSCSIRWVWACHCCSACCLTICYMPVSQVIGSAAVHSEAGDPAQLCMPDNVVRLCRVLCTWAGRLQTRHMCSSPARQGRA